MLLVSANEIAVRAHKGDVLDRAEEPGIGEQKLDEHAFVVPVALALAAVGTLLVEEGAEANAQTLQDPIHVAHR
jgi:hypothetical protein